MIRCRTEAPAACPASAANSFTCRGTSGTLSVTASSAPIRTTYYQTGGVVDTVHRGKQLYTNYECVNTKGNLWYYVDKTSGVKNGWIYSGNVSFH